MFTPRSSAYKWKTHVSRLRIVRRQKKLKKLGKWRRSDRILEPYVNLLTVVRILFI